MSQNANAAAQPPAPYPPMKDVSVGQPMDRVDGRLKVTGGARYAAEMPVSGVLHAVLITSTIAKGKVAAMDTADAEKVEGVRLVLTPFNAAKLPQPPRVSNAPGRPAGRKLQMLQDDLVLYSRQPIGVVVADTLEQAIHGAALVRVKYDAQTPVAELHKGRIYQPGHANDKGASPVSHQGDIDEGRRQAKAAVEVQYTTPIETHNPMEPHGTIAVWDGPDKLTVYDATQGIFGVQSVLASTFQIPAENVRCVCYFTGGGFGCKGSVWSHVPLAAMAAQKVGKPVKLVLAREQMFGIVGYRPFTEQKLLLGADGKGSLTVTTHDVLSNTSTFDEFTEYCSGVTRMLYTGTHRFTSQMLSQLDVGTPTFMRAPGESSGSWALESSMDELAYALGMDPIALRLQNYAEEDPERHRPFSSKSLRECYAEGAKRFGWDRRNPKPRSMRAPDGRLLGMGMATATYPANRGGASAMARILPDGSAYVQAGTQDLGTGTYTICTQIAADALGLPPSKVRFALGDTNMPRTPGSGGSTTATTTGSAVKLAADAARQSAITLAVGDPMSPLHGLALSDIAVKDGRLVSKADSSRSDTYGALVTRAGSPIEERRQAAPGAERQEFSFHGFGAVFAEVLVDPDLGEIRVSRATGVYGIGNVLNAKTCRSQLMGGIVWGIGMALLEQTLLDKRHARVVNADLAEYHVPVNADVPPIEIAFVNEVDPYVSPVGAKGVGEIGITGIVAALGNAVYHATGVRVRDLPITLDKVMA